MDLQQIWVSSYKHVADPRGFTENAAEDGWIYAWIWVVCRQKWQKPEQTWGCWWMGITKMRKNEHGFANGNNKCDETVARQSGWKQRIYKRGWRSLFQSIGENTRFAQRSWVAWSGRWRQNDRLDLLYFFISVCIITKIIQKINIQKEYKIRKLYPN